MKFCRQILVFISVFFCLLEAACGRGPTADEAVVFSAIDLSLPQLESVKKAVDKGDYEAASKLFADYIRNRKLNWLGTPPPRFNREVAESALKGRVYGGTSKVWHTYRDGKIDWSYNATRNNPDVAYTMEWQCQLNRMFFWVEMAGAYAKEKNEAYPKVWAKQLHGWIEQAGEPPKKSAAEINAREGLWRTIDTAIRLGNCWPRAFFTFLNSPSIKDADIIAYLRTTIDQARHLRQKNTETNFLLMEMNALVVTSAIFPELKEADEWRSYAMRRLLEEMKTQLLPDGAHVELSTGYHNDVVIGNFVNPVDALKCVGMGDKVPPQYFENLEKAFEWTMALVTPDGKRPTSNSSWIGAASTTFKIAVRLFPWRDDFLWFASNGLEGVHPEWTSKLLDWSGFAVMRSGWESDANYLMFDIGPLGAGHWHNDKLTVNMWPYGRRLLFDNGGGQYERSKWREYSVASYAHNTVIVDGLSQNRPSGKQWPNFEEKKTIPDFISQEPIDALWHSDAVYDFATGLYDSTYGTANVGKQKFRPATHRRSVLFVKPDLFIVADTLTPLDDKSHEYEARWHLLSTRASLDKFTGTVTTEDSELPNLAIVPLLTRDLTVDPVKARDSERISELAGWDVTRDGHYPATTVLHTRRGKGVQQFLTLLVPIQMGETNPVKQVRAGNPAYVTMADGREFEIGVSADGKGISFKEKLPDAGDGRRIAAGEGM